VPIIDNEWPSENEPPQANAVLWRFMTFSKFVAMLEDGALWFSRPDHLNDPFEAGPSSEEFEATVASPSIDVNRLGDSSESRSFDEQVATHSLEFTTYVLKMHVVNCWHHSAVEPQFMWRMYASDDEGIAIRTTFGSLMSALRSECPVRAGTVHYGDIGISHGTNRLFRKRAGYSAEQEVRLVCLPGLQQSTPYNAAPVGVNVPVDLNVLIEEVVVAPDAPNWFEVLVRRLCQRGGLQRMVRRSEFASRPFADAQARMIIERGLRQLE
jgi:hypothetical protein